MKQQLEIESLKDKLKQIEIQNSKRDNNLEAVSEVNESEKRVLTECQHEHKKNHHVLTLKELKEPVQTLVINKSGRRYIALPRRGG